MGYPVKIVVRKRDNKFKSGFASELPLNKGWIHVKDFGKWYGSQMNYKPFKKALKDAESLATIYNARARVKLNLKDGKALMNLKNIIGDN